MKQNLTAQAKFNKLREQAERLMIKPNFVTEQSAFEDPLRLINELQVCQVELEMQNDELQRSQQEFMESQIRYKELYDLEPVGYITVNLKGLILNANLILAEMLSMERSCLINQPLSTYIHFEDQDIFYHHQRNLYDLKTGQSCKLRMQKKDGTQFAVQLESTVVSDKYGNPEKYRIVAIDITDRNKTVKALKENQERYQSLSKMLRLMCDNVPDMVWAKDLEKKYIFANKATCRNLLNAADTEEPIGKTDLFFC